MVGRAKYRQCSQLHLVFLALSFMTCILFIFQSLQLAVLHPSPLNTPTTKMASPYHKLPTEQNPRPRAVFYNIYIPDAAEKRSRTMGIVKEQLSEMSDSRLLISARLYYNVIGQNATDDIQRICGNKCQALNFFEKGDEGLTLRAVYDYCHKHLEKETLVTYIHDKGSMHPTPKNRHFRHLLTKGAFSDACQTIGRNGNSCNVCGSRFSPFPHHHMAGNMWTAQCSYIRELHPPDKFGNEIESLMTVVMQHPKNPSDPKPTFQQYQYEYFVGRGRYALEHWLGSHPSARPCDVYSGEYLSGYNDLPTATDLWTPDLQPAPRFPVSVFQKRAPRDGNWFCGQARLLEFQYLYGRPPPQDSFLWEFYSQAFKSCTEPLDYDEHASMFANYATIRN